MTTIIALTLAIVMALMNPAKRRREKKKRVSRVDFLLLRF